MLIPIRSAARTLLLLCATQTILGRDVVAQSRAAPPSLPEWSKCGPPASSRVLPPIDAVIDTALVFAVLARDSIANGTLLLRTRFEPAGTLSSFGVLTSDMPEDQLHDLVLAMANAIKRLPVGSRRWYRLALAMTPRPVLSIQPSSYCPPQGDEMGVLVRASVPAGKQVFSQPTRWEIVISDSGQVIAARILGGTGHVALEDSAQAHIRAMRFKPALVDGRATAVADTIDWEVLGVDP